MGRRRQSSTTESLYRYLRERRICIGDLFAKFITLQTDIGSEGTVKEISEICQVGICLVYNPGVKLSSPFKASSLTSPPQIACEKFSALEKGPKERNNQKAAAMIKEALDKKMNGPFNVVVGESFLMDVVHVEKTLFYMYFGGYLAVLVWKCV